MIRKNGISAPEGYFDDLREELLRIPSERVEAPSRGIRRLAPYLAYAASLLLLVGIGNFILRQTASQGTEVPQEQEYYLSELARYADPEFEFEDSEPAASEGDIIEYLIADGTSVEHLEYYLAYEENL